VQSRSWEMKLNISYPSTGLQKVVVVDDEKKLAMLYDKRLSQEISGDFLGEEFKGYVFRITGGHDKQGFTMKQGVLADHRVRLLLKGGPCYRPRRSGERRRKSVRGCIISHDISALAFVVVKKGEKDIEGLTDGTKPRRLGPKRASKIRKLFALSKKDDVRKYVIRREITEKKEKGDFKRKKPKTKAPKIQRLVTPVTLARKRHLRAVRINRMHKSKELASAYQKLITKRKLEATKKSRATKLHSRLRSQTGGERASKSSKGDEKDTASKKVEKEVKSAAPAKAAAAPAKAAAPTKAAAAAPAKAAAPVKAADKKAEKKADTKKDAPAAKPAEAKKEEKKAEKPKEAPKPAAVEKPKEKAADKSKAADKKPAGDKKKSGGK